MKLKALLFVALAVLVSCVIIAQVTEDSTTTTIAHVRNVTAVRFAINDAGSLEVTCRYTRTASDGTNSLATIELRQVTLSGTNLNAVLSAAGLPSQATLKSRLNLLAQTAWTNSIVQ